MAIISRGNISIDPEGDEELEIQLKDFLGIDPPGISIETYLSRLSGDALDDWRTYWSKIFRNLRRDDIVEDYVKPLWRKYIDLLEDNEPTQPIEEDDIITPQPEPDVIHLEPEPDQEDEIWEVPENEKLSVAKEELKNARDTLTDLEAESGGIWNRYLIWRQKNVIESWEKEVARITAGLPPEMIYNIIPPLGGSGGQLGFALGTGGSGMGIPPAIVGGATGFALGGAGGITAASAATTLSGANILFVWMASDNILTGTAFTLKKLRESLANGTITEAEAINESEKVQEWINVSTDFVELSSKFNPILLPFRNILLINAEKAQKDFDLEVMLMKEIGKKKVDRKKIFELKQDIKEWKEEIETLKEERSVRIKTDRIARLEDNISNKEKTLTATEKEAIKKKQLEEDIQKLNWKLETEKEIKNLDTKAEEAKNEIDDLKEKNL